MLPFFSLLYSELSVTLQLNFWKKIRRTLRASLKVELQSCFLIARQNLVKNIVTEGVCFSVSKVFGPMRVLPDKVGEEYLVTQRNTDRNRLWKW